MEKIGHQIDILQQNSNVWYFIFILFMCNSFKDMFTNHERMYHNDALQYRHSYVTNKVDCPNL